jgi:hypothetical protein
MSAKLLPLGVALAVAAGALVAVALGQDLPIRITATVKVTPDKAGTPRHPQGGKVDVRGTIDTPRDVDPPIAKSVDVWFPKGGLYNGRKWPACGKRTLDRGGPGACPPRSIMGSGIGVADADGVTTHPRMTVVNGGQRVVYLYVVLQRPARVRTAVPATVTKLSSPRWSYRAHANVPRNLQIVAGIPLRLQSFHATVGRGDWIATTSCPRDRRWRYHVEARYTSGQLVQYDGAVGCRS